MEIPNQVFIYNHWDLQALVFASFNCDDVLFSNQQTCLGLGKDTDDTQQITNRVWACFQNWNCAISYQEG